MDKIYLDGASKCVPNTPVLINLVSKRTRQLNSGQRPLVVPDSPHMPNVDIALKEVAEGLLTAEMVSEEVAQQAELGTDIFSI